MRDEQNRMASDNEVRAHQLLYPDERIVSFLARNYPDRARNTGLSALDIGCGSGRHVKLLLDYGFQCYGIDYAANAIDVARAQIGEHLRLRTLLQADLKDNPFGPGSFDVVVQWGVAFLRPRAEMVTDLRTVHAAMKTSGRMIVNFRTRDNWFYGKGQSLETETTYLLNEAAGPYANMCYTFLGFDEASELLAESGFEIENSERLDLWLKKGTEQHSWWVFWTRKQE